VVTALQKSPKYPLSSLILKSTKSKKTKEAVALLESVHAYADCLKSKNSRKVRPGKGKARNRRYVQSRGPLVIHTKDLRTSNVIQAFRNIPGVQLVNVNALNLLTLAPGGHLGRFVVWTESAFKSLNRIFGTLKTDSEVKSGYRPPRAVLTNADVNRIINSDEIQSVLRTKKSARRFHTQKRNPLKNFGVMVKLNPFALTQKKRSLIAAQKAKSEHKKKVKKVSRKTSKQFLTILHAPSVAPVRGPEEMPPKY